MERDDVNPEEDAPRQSTRDAARASAPSRRFLEACAQSDVATADCARSLWALLVRWPWASLDDEARLAELLEDHAHWRLFQKSRSGDDDAVRRFEREWTAYARASLSWRLPRIEVDEVASSFFERVYRLIGPSYAWKSPFTVYLRTILLNLARTRLRRLRTLAQREVALEPTSEAGPHSPASSDESPEDHVLREERARALESALLELAPLDRHVVRAVLVDGTSVETLATTLGISRAALYKRLQRARLRLRAALVRQPALSKRRGKAGLR